QTHLVFERFFDETGDMHFVIHSPFGTRINRAWGLALRKRFCRRFNFELQAAATEDNLILSLGPTHSFPLDEPAQYLKSGTVTDILIQALLDAPMFPIRWRWVTNTALAVPRNRAGKKVPAPFQRNNAEDLIALIFPDQLACFENIAGDREVPEHPLVDQVLYDCLHDVMDIDGLVELLKNIEQKNIQITTRDLATPSPLALEIINARPYAFLDDGAAEERRTLAIQQRRHLTPADAADIGRLDHDAIQKVKEEAWPLVRNADELHDALMVLGFISADEGMAQGWLQSMQFLQQQQRSTIIKPENGMPLWVAAERLHHLLVLFPKTAKELDIEATDPIPDDKSAALIEVLRSRLEGLGPVSVELLNKPLSLPVTEIEVSLLNLQQEGFAIQGHFSQSTQIQWCERGLLARIHRYTLKQLRNEIDPVSPVDFMRFLFHWHGFDDPAEGAAALERTLQQLEGIPMAASSWEQDILPSRILDFSSSQLDQLCQAGKFIWLRLQAPFLTKSLTKSQTKNTKQKNPAVKSTPISFIGRSHITDWRSYSAMVDINEITLSANANTVYSSLKQWGASFFQELSDETRLLPSQLETALGELVAWGLITSDSFSGLRTLITPQKILRRRSKRLPGHVPLAQAGRWSLLRGTSSQTHELRFTAVEYIARVLLNRYGIVFRKVIENEVGLPPWRDLVYVYRRMEARGELRGGRFVQGFAGEQFALPNAMNALRKIRKQDKDGKLVSISASDPLNLTGSITAGDRIASISNNRILYRDGIPIANSIAGEVNYLESIEAAIQWEIKTTLLHKHKPEHFHQPPVSTL
ncbi:MAG: ATP-dependent DNA helicase, partial [Gammaproteobacteria bacterium]|nr:ATP-dependent DNA helicase [Gammaproteobacteria bacterium]